MKDLIYKIQYLIFRIFKSFFLILPEKARFSVGEKIAILGYYLIRSRKVTTLINLEMAFPEKTIKERKRIAKESYRTMGKAFLGTIWLEEYIKDENNFHVHNFKMLEDEATKSPVVFATMHFGNMESLLKYSQQFPYVTVAKKQRNPYLNRYISDNRKHLNIILIEKSKKTSRELFKYAEEGRNIALFSDHRDKGTDVEFFGMNTVSPTGAATLAIRYNRPLILGYCLFNKDNTTEVFLEKIEIENNQDKSLKENVHITTQKLISRMEDIIAANPEQWLWMHDRWKLYRNRKKK